MTDRTTDEGATEDAVARVVSGASALELPHHGVWVADGADVVVFANRLLCDLLGSRALVGRPALDLFPDSERPLVRERAALRAFGAAQEYDTLLQTVDGFTVPVRLSSSPRFAGDGTYVGSVVLARDLRVERSLQAAQAEALSLQLARGQEEQLNRYLTTGLAHELNTSLQAVLGFAELLAEDEAAPAPMRSTLDKLRESALRSNRLVGNLLALAQAGEERAAALDAVAVVEEALESRAGYLPANNVVVWREYPDDGPALVYADLPRLRRVVGYLVNAACEAALVGGGGSLRVAVVPYSDGVVIDVELTGHEFPAEIVRFDPTDIGPKMPTQTLVHAVVDAMVTDLGGELRVDNTATGGLATLVLPAAPAEAEAPARGAPAGRPAAAEEASEGDDGPPRARILVIDDERFILDLNEEALSGIGDVTTALSADEAVGLVTERAFDLIISDLRMPGALDGMGLFRWMRDTRPDLAARVVFTTADTLSPQAHEFLQTCGRPYIQKPYNIRDYRQLVQRELAGGEG